VLATVFSRGQLGMEAPEVTIDVHLSEGLPTMTLVGLPEAAVKESRERVRSAVINAGFEWPPGRITINLAPADLPKEGGRFDLPIALCLLAADGRIPGRAVAAYELYGELSLGGELRAVPGILSAVVRATQQGRPVIVPRATLHEAQLVVGARIVSAANLSEVIGHVRGVRPLPVAEGSAPAREAAAQYPDLTDVCGQARACRALEIAAAGSHSVLMVGPPGSGKSMLAQRLPGLLPPLTPAEALEAAMIASANPCGFRPESWSRRPFRSPHHTASAVALVGGGSLPVPGEISLAHHGVLFLDELVEFAPEALEALREPLENGRITVSRAARQVEFPARFQLAAAMNPCPCGHFGDGTARCRCGELRIERYQGRLSGPLLDRLDLQVRITPVEPAALERGSGRAERSAMVAGRVVSAREAQLRRQGVLNAALDNAGVGQHCVLGEEARCELRRAAERLRLSGRAYYRVLRVARTIADLSRAEGISARAVAEAVSFRALDLYRVASPRGARSYLRAGEGATQWLEREGLRPPAASSRQ